MRGDAQMYFAPVNLARDQSAAGKVNAIAAATAKRIPEMPNTPTFTEAGLPFVYDSWFGLMAPHGVPKPILDKISKDWADALKTPEMQEKLKSQFLIGVTDTPEAMDKIDQGRDRKSDKGVQGGRHLSLPLCIADFERAWKSSTRARVSVPARLGVADHALDRRRTAAQRAFDLVDLLVHRLHRERRIDPAVEIDDLAFVGFAHPHVVDVADHAAFGRDLGERHLDRRDPLRRRFAAGGLRRLQRLDMGLDLDRGAEFLAERRFEPVGDVVGGAERKPAVDLEIERDRELAADVVHGDMVHGERPGCARSP